MMQLLDKPREIVAVYGSIMRLRKHQPSCFIYCCNHAHERHIELLLIDLDIGIFAWPFFALNCSLSETNFITENYWYLCPRDLFQLPEKACFLSLHFFSIEVGVPLHQFYGLILDSMFSVKHLKSPLRHSFASKLLLKLLASLGERQASHFSRVVSDVRNSIWVSDS